MFKFYNDFYNDLSFENKLLTIGVLLCSFCYLWAVIYCIYAGWWLTLFIILGATGFVLIATAIAIEDFK